ncbi:MAG: serine hydrolase domain-containing protein [Burkholderiaceae bacterium]
MSRANRPGDVPVAAQVPSAAPPLASAREHLPDGQDFLLWPPSIQPWGYRIVDRLFATRVIERAASAEPLARGREIDVRYPVGGQVLDTDAFMERNVVAGLLVMHEDRVVLERYGLGLRPHDRWSTMSTIKSMTAFLVGVALREGAIASLDDGVVGHLPALRGSAYEGVSIRHLLTMSSGVRWNEDYTDRESDVNRYSRSMARQVAGACSR